MDDAAAAEYKELSESAVTVGVGVGIANLGRRARTAVVVEEVVEEAEKAVQYTLVVP